MKVLIVHSTNNIISGAEYAIFDLLQPLPTEFDVEMLTPGKGILSDFYRNQGFKVQTKRFLGPRRKYPGLYLLSSIVLAFWLRVRKYDIILCNTFAASFRISLGTKLAGLRLVIYTREYFSKNKKVNFKQIKRANAILAVSEDVKDYYENFHHSVYVCHDRINLEAIEQKLAAKSEDLLIKNFINIGFVGRITSYKQPDLFIRAVPYVLKEIPDARFHIVGKSIAAEADYEHKLKQMAKDLGLIEYIRFWGFREDAVEMLSDMDIFCLTSDREPFPRTLLEAMAVKTPVICSNTGGCTEMIEDGFNGLYFNVSALHTEIALAEKILLLVKDKDLYLSIQQNALKTVTANFGGDIQAKHFINILLLIKGKSI